MFKLSEVKDYPLEQIREISKQLNTADENPEYKLDCSDVYGLDDDILEALFSGIRHDWQDGRELDNFMTGLNGDLLGNIKNFLQLQPSFNFLDNSISINFSFLKVKDLAELATLAEKYYQSDPNTSLIKCRQFIEVCAKYVSAKVGIYEQIKNEKLIYIINQLRNKKAIRDRIYYLFNDVRNLANSEVHLDPEHSTTININNRNKINPKTALKCIKKIHKLAIWFHKSYYLDPKIPFKDPVYVQPPDPNKLIEELKIKIEQLKQQNKEQLAQELNIKIEEVKSDQESLVHEEEEINVRLQSSDLDKELTRIYQETMLDPDVLQSNIRKGGDIDSQTMIGTWEEGDTEEADRYRSGQILDNRYEIIDELSSGSFGTTYTAYDLKKPNKPICVVKQFTPKQSDEGTFSKARTLFYQEAEILERLGSHPEIPQLFTYYEENNNLFLVQEYIEGNTLRDELDDQWQEKLVIQLLKDILTPLVFVHQKEIVHRDIKPENLIRRVGDNKIVIIDFGAVKQVLLQEGSKQGTVIGTKNYMSPEQFMGNISYACDIYAVGIIGIEAITGKKISEGLSPKQYLEEITFISDELKQILLKMTAFSPEQRYSSAQEALDEINQLLTEPSGQDGESDVGGDSGTSGTDEPLSWWQKIPKLWLISGGIGVVLLGGLFIKSLPYLTKTKLAQTDLEMGILWKPESYQGLAEYIEDNTVPANYLDFLKGKEVKVLINGDKTLPYAEAQNRMESKQWDIAFALSPINSIFAKQQGYTHIASMFPGSNSYQSGFFVRRDNPIQNLGDLTPSTRVAMGGFNSASSFYMPVYDLFGKTITANTGNRGQDIITLVKEGKADVGVAAIGDSIRKDDPELRIIHVSREIPGSGVYLSPQLSTSDQDKLEQLLLNAPENLQKSANYGAGQEPDYSEFLKITERVNDILVCADFSQNPVTLGCKNDIKTITGNINGVSVTGVNSILKLSAEGKVYNLTVPWEEVKDIFGSDQLVDIQGKSVEVKTDQIQANNDIKINQPSQIKVLSGL